MTPNDYLVSLIRAYVPVGVGLGLAWLAVHFGIVIDQAASSGLKLGAGTVTVGVYYAGARGSSTAGPASAGS